jgi:hypothetical protein
MSVATTAAVPFAINASLRFSVDEDVQNTSNAQDCVYDQSTVVHTCNPLLEYDVAVHMRNIHTFSISPANVSCVLPISAACEPPYFRKQRWEPTVGAIAVVLATLAIMVVFFVKKYGKCISKQKMTTHTLLPIKAASSGASATVTRRQIVAVNYAELYKSK